MARPDYGVITSIGREHLEFFRDLDGVVQEEGILAELLPAGGRLFINADTAMAEAICSRTSARVVRVGSAETCDWRVYGIRVTRSGTRFRLASPRAELTGEYKIPLLGRHQAVNAALAVAVAAEQGLSREAIDAGLLACEPARMRLQVWEYRGVTVLDDAYNANADSMSAALETLRELPCKGRRVAVLGNMAELGAESEAAHEEVGRKAAECGVEQLFAIGSMAQVFARGARSAGLNRVMEFPDATAAAVAVKSFLRDGDLLLLKASRASRLERLTELLRQNGGKK
jgi:UDP-N-acetylmuramoyl-tripeptide--D-alanyl-D-alanine ligase